MNGKISQILLIALILGASITAYLQHEEASDLTQKLQAQTKVISEQKDKIVELENTVNQEKNFIHNEQDQVKTELLNLSVQLQSQWGRLEVETQNINELKQQIHPQDQDLQARIIQHANLITDLESRLKLAQSAERDLGNEGNDALKNSKAKTQADTLALNSQIQSQQALVKSTQDQLNFWRARKGDINQATKVEEYQQNLAQQTATLQQLQAQKFTISQNELNQTGNIKQAVFSEKETLKSSQVQLSDQLKRAQADLKNLRDQQQNESKSTAEIKSKIRNLEQSYNVDYSKYQSLREAMKQKQLELHKIQSAN